MDNLTPREKQLVKQLLGLAVNDHCMTLKQFGLTSADIKVAQSALKKIK